MRWITCTTFILLCLTFSPIQTHSQSEDYIIFSISQSFPMKSPDEKTTKNFYVSLGENQGVEAGTVLDVFRTFSRRDPYESKKRFNYTVKIGQLKVIHTESNRAVAKFEKFSNLDQFYLENEKFMIGDRVAVNLN